MGKRKIDDKNSTCKRIKSGDTDELDVNLLSESFDNEVYNNKSIELILSNCIEEKVINVDIISCGLDELQGNQRYKQQERLIRKLKRDIYPLESLQMIEKFYVIGEKNNSNIFAAASIIRMFSHGNENVVKLFPLIDYGYSFEVYSQLNKESVFDNLEINICSKKRCGSLINNKGIVISSFVEIVKLRICNIDNKANIEEQIKGILEDSTKCYEVVHKKILRKYGNNHLSDQGYYNSSEGSEKKVNEVQQLPLSNDNNGDKGRVVSFGDVGSKCKTHNNKYVRLNDTEAVKVFAEAVECWDIKLFEEAKSKSKDFIKLVDYFDKEIRHKFWGHFFRNSYYKACVNEKDLSGEKMKVTEERYSDLLQSIEVYVFLINNVPNILDKFKEQQYSIIRGLPEDRQNNRSRDLIELIELEMSKIKNEDGEVSSACDQVIADILDEIVSSVSNDLQKIDQESVELLLVGSIE